MRCSWAMILGDARFIPAEEGLFDQRFSLRELVDGGVFVAGTVKKAALELEALEGDAPGIAETQERVSGVLGRLAGDGGRLHPARAAAFLACFFHCHAPIMSSDPDTFELADERPDEGG